MPYWPSQYHPIGTNRRRWSVTGPGTIVGNGVLPSVIECAFANASAPKKRVRYTSVLVVLEPASAITRFGDGTSMKRTPANVPASPFHRSPGSLYAWGSAHAAVPVDWRRSNDTSGWMNAT